MSNLKVLRMSKKNSARSFLYLQVGRNTALGTYSFTRFTIDH